jgi:uncharacterized protein
VNRVFIIDTNVVVSGLLTVQAQSPVAQILDAMLKARFSFVVSQALLDEYRLVLQRPKLCKLHGLSEGEIDTILTQLVQHAIVLPPAENKSTAQMKLVAPDPGDQFLWDLLSSRTDLMLVTGDHALKHNPTMPGRVISPQAFVGQFLN